MSAEVKKDKPKKDIYLRALVIILTVVFCLVAIYYKDYLLVNMANLAGYSLLGMLVIAFCGYFGLTSLLNFLGV